MKFVRKFEPMINLLKIKADKRILMDTTKQCRNAPVPDISL